MAKIKKWCTSTESNIKSHKLTHKLTYLEADAAQRDLAVASVAGILPSHYAAAPRIAHILAVLGKAEAAEYLMTKLPTGAKSRSGDIGEILASSFVSEFTDFKDGILKLRWADHREMAMRGDDLIAIKVDPGGKVELLKGEVKSRAKLAKKTVEEARTALSSSGGRPTPHALAFIADRLFESGRTDLSDIIDKAQLKIRISQDQMSHMIFVLTGNNPCALLSADLTAYAGKIPQLSVGLRVATHQTFIKEIFEKVIADAKKP